MSPVEVLEALLARHRGRRAQRVLPGRRRRRPGAGAAPPRRAGAAGAPAGPLDGVPIAIKDAVPHARLADAARFADDRSAAGLGRRRARRSPRLRASGAVLVGKTTTPEFGWKGVTDSPLTGITRNPWDPGRTAGRLERRQRGGGRRRHGVRWRSAPTAAARSASRAGFCGLVGTQADVRPRSRCARRARSAPLAHVGPMTRTVHDAALMLDVIGGPTRATGPRCRRPRARSANGSTTAWPGCRIAFSPDLGYAERRSGGRGVGRARRGGRWPGSAPHVEEVDPGFADPRAGLPRRCGSPAAAKSRGLPRRTSDLVDPGLREICEEGRTLSALRLPGRDGRARWRSVCRMGRVPRALRPAA